MTPFPLTIFPEGGLVSSIITTVWVGVFVLCFFNLRFGWVLSGLVVPGYIVPLVIVKPMAAAVIVVEAILAYILVWLFSEKLSRGRFPSLFGRDRFMGLILASIAVRLVLDGWLLPIGADWLEANFDRRFDWQDNLQSFGLVIISLLANQFWKPGLGRGLVSAFVTIGITFVIVRFGLMEFTNFRMSAVTYMYEGLASSILASPKAYIILTLTALIASHMNVRYGWDFSGILIPALIALQWYQPAKIVTSFVEAIVIYVIARLLLKLPSLANATIEGGRKLLLFFNISFAWKMALGWFIVWQGFDVKTTDFYGFGYLLSTLIAIKAHDKDIFPRLARSTLQVSLMGAVFGNIVGFALSAAVSRGTGADDETSVSGGSVDDRLDLLVVEAIGDAHIRAASGTAAALSEGGRAGLAELVASVERGLPVASPEFDLRAQGWRLLAVGGGRMAIVRDDGAGHEMLLFDPAASRALAVIVRDPTLAQGLGAAGLALKQRLEARWLVLAAPAAPSSLGSDGVADIFTEASTAVALEVEPSDGEQTSITYANAAAGTIDLASLRAFAPAIATSIDISAREVADDRAVLKLSEPNLADVVANLAPKLRGDAACRLVSGAGKDRGWDQLERLAFLRYEIAAPLIEGSREGKVPMQARAAAAIGGFGVALCQLGGRDHWMLFSNRRDEGQLLLAAGRPVQHSVLTWDDGRDRTPAQFGALIHARWGGDALLIAAQPERYGRSPRNSMTVIWQELVRQQEADGSDFTLHLRPHPADVAIMPGRPDLVVTSDIVGPPHAQIEPLVSAMRKGGLRPTVSDGGLDYAGFEASPALAERYFGATTGRRYAIGWVRTRTGDQP
ncbi:poly-gamma-glutamate biosynthesis protein PgsC/CapC [Qipengyuania sp. 6B39]|uniref:poly-gamma-glutamate biosynthesis protein PgsC/CapC n=1 Tax=Qipengyuania proteolytica TaxID=2867239 RepID=UPI001C8A8853|nr:poly-gamma-glutamate biosynthesis protein PgsC/CapC [Qipengyuania proteolytica]MBX7494627.1 poly-gamma-glutamate biosynthesis protein PgsC/CapC [Qipengyuania proteolytica]